MKPDSNDEMAKRYQTVILDHNKNQRNFRNMNDHTCCH